MNDQVQRYVARVAQPTIGSGDYVRSEDYDALRDDRDRLRSAIQTVLADEETGAGGWGPDETMADVLRAALAQSEKGTP